MRAPFDVALFGTDRQTLHIGSRLSDLNTVNTSPGGFASVTATLHEPLMSDALTGYSEMAVYDRATAEQVGGGRLTDPGKSVDGSGQVWQIAALGEGPAHMADTTAPYPLFETSLDGFYMKGRTTLAGEGSVGAAPTTSDYAVVLGASGGSVLGNGIVAAMFYDRLAIAGFNLGGIRYTRVAGQTAAGYQVECAVYGLDGSPATATIVSTNFNTAAGTIAAEVVNTDFTIGADIVRLTMRRSAGAITVADDTTWCAYYDLHVAARRFLEDGTAATDSAHGTAYVLSSEIVADMLGRRLTRFDGAHATVTATTHHVDQFSYPDGVTDAQLMDDILALERAMTWHAWERMASGLYRFEFVPWSTTARYDATVADGFTSPSPSTDLYNEVNVRWRDLRGNVTTTLVTGTVPSLSFTRTAMVDLADEVGSAANAQRAGEQFLEDHQYPPNTGTLRVARPVMDHDTGRMVKPWMLRAGNLIRVRGVRPYVDSLNASDRDGVTVFRIVSVSYSDSDGAATLELDTYSRNEAREIARLTNTRRRKN